MLNLCMSNACVRRSRYRITHAYRRYTHTKKKNTPLNALMGRKWSISVQADD